MNDTVKAADLQGGRQEMKTRDLITSKGGAPNLTLQRKGCLARGIRGAAWRERYLFDSHELT
jgi:hypothetical protein